MPRELARNGFALRGRLAPTSYTLPQRITFDQWADEATVLYTTAAGSMWWLGDWLRHGEDRWEDRYTQVIASDWNLDLCQRAMRTCERFPADDRNESLSFWEHYEAARLPTLSQRRRVLAQAEQEAWTRGQLRAAVHGLLRDQEPGADARPPSPSEIVRLFAAHDPLDSERVCGWCDGEASHGGACPWVLARAWCEAHPEARV